MKRRLVPGNPSATTSGKVSSGALSVVLALATVAIVPLVAAGPAAANPPLTPTTCTPQAGFDTCLRFDVTGEPSTFTVPNGVAAVHAVMWGAAGGGGVPQADSTAAAGGAGGYTTGTFSTTSGQNLVLTVGQGGSPADTSAAFLGSGAGGNGSNDSTIGAAGGGMSAIWSDSALGTPLLIAAGGGGAGGNTDQLGAFDLPSGGGGGGGTSGQGQTDSTDYFGSGGTQSAGGTAATALDAACSTSATAGDQFAGGNGGGGSDATSLGGGGGGGGYFGGGGGACRTVSDTVGSGGGGGGGSAFIASSVVWSSTAAAESSGPGNTAAEPAGTSDPLYETGIGVGAPGVDGNPGEIVLEYDSSPTAPTPGNVTSEGTGTAAQAPTITVPAGGTLRLLVDSLPVTNWNLTGEGGYSVNTATNVITFTPAFGFFGDATPVTFQLTNSSLQTGTATYTPHVTKPAGPSPLPLSSSGTGTAHQTATVTIPTQGSVALLDNATQTQTITVANQGTYTLSGDTITFAPVLGFSGTATPIDYQVTDAYFTPGTATYTAHVTVPPGPAASAISSTGPAGVTQRPSLEVPPGGSVSLVSGGSAVNSLTIAGQGTYLADPLTARLSFTPLPTFIGAVTPVTYRVTDAYTQHADSSYSARVTPAGTATASAPALVRLSSQVNAIPVTCRVSLGLLHRCDATLTYAFHARIYVVGTGTVILSAAAATRAVTFAVRPNALGRYLAAFLGGVPTTVSVAVTQIGNPVLLPARTVTAFVDATVLAPQATYFGPWQTELTPADRSYLDSLRSRLGGIRSITCFGNTDPVSSPLINWLIGYARAANSCTYLARATRITTVSLSYGATRPVASNSSAFGQALNRRADITLSY